MAKKKIEAVDEKDFSTQFFKTNEEFHYNFMEYGGDYKVSSGSLLFDKRIDGGFHSGILRFVGDTEGGKTSEALVVLKNFLTTVDGSKGIFIKAEGRLSQDMMDRSGITFVFDPKEWEVGTCLVFECNVFEVVFDWLRGIYRHGPRYCVVFDSMNGFIRTEDLDKPSSEAVKVAGAAVVQSDFLRRISLGFSKRGHLGIMLAQRRADVRINQYEAIDRNKLGGATGGNAAVHYPDWVFEFLRKKDLIFLDEANQDEPDGHYVHVRIHKSTNETTYQTFKYPVRHKKGIWQEREIVELMQQWGFIIKKGSWFNFDADVIKAIPELSEVTIQGMSKLYEFVETNEEIKDKLRLFVYENILNQ